MSKITVVINNMEGDRFNLKTLDIDIKKNKKNSNFSSAYCTGEKAIEVLKDIFGKKFVDFGNGCTFEY